MKAFKLSGLLAIILLCSSQLLIAAEPQGAPPTGTSGGQQAGEQQGGTHHRGPSPEALKACEGKTAGATASFVNRKGDTVNGTCQLVVVPEHPPK